MTIELITACYREDFLLPLFMNHYQDWVDRMTLITECRADGKFDDHDKMDWINEAIRRSHAHWVVLVDLDEFIYPDPYGANPRKVLENENADVIYSHMTRAWRHETDVDIDRTQPPVPQRLHGEPDHIKPAVFRPHGVVIGAGNHDLQADHDVATGRPWAGAHWANADPCFWTLRTTRDRGPRLSERNIAAGHGTHNLIGEEKIRALCEQHARDPQIIFLPGA